MLSEPVIRDTLRSPERPVVTVRATVDGRRARGVAVDFSTGQEHPIGVALLVADTQAIGATVLTDERGEASVVLGFDRGPVQTVDLVASSSLADGTATVTVELAPGRPHSIRVDGRPPLVRKGSTQRPSLRIRDFSGNLPNVPTTCSGGGVHLDVSEDCTLTARSVGTGDIVARSEETVDTFVAFAVPDGRVIETEYYGAVAVSAFDDRGNVHLTIGGVNPLIYPVWLGATDSLVVEGAGGLVVLDWREASVSPSPVAHTRQLVADTVPLAHPSVCGEEDRIFFVRRAEIWEIRRDGSGLRRLGPEGSLLSAPSPSPDCRKLVVESDEEGLVLDVETGSLTPLGVRGKRFRWAPDGEWIAYIAGTGAAPTEEEVRGELWLVRPDGSGAHRLDPDTASVNGYASLAWSPDSKFLLLAPSCGERCPSRGYNLSAHLVDVGTLETMVLPHWLGPFHRKGRRLGPSTPSARVPGPRWRATLLVDTVSVLTLYGSR